MAIINMINSVVINKQFRIGEATCANHYTCYFLGLGDGIYFSGARRSGKMLLLSHNVRVYRLSINILPQEHEI